jgi:drug/metabolite transporter (DMT)-like permease
MARPMRRNALAHLLLLAVVFVWGTTFVLIKAALADVSPLLFNLLRMALAALVMLALYHRRLRRLSRSQLLPGVVAGIFLAAGYQFQTAGLRLTTPSKSAFLTGMVVVFVPFLSLTRRLRAPGAARPGVGAFAGAALGLAGLTMLAVPSGPLLDLASIERGDWLTLCCAFAFSLHLLTLGHSASRVPFQVLAPVQIATAAVVLLVTLPLFEPHPFLHARPVFFAAWLIAALLSTAAAFAIQSWAQSFLPASHTALLLALEPVFAAATSWLVLGQGLHGRPLAGAALVLSAIVLSELFPSGGVQPSAHEAAPPVNPSSETLEKS